MANSSDALAALNALHEFSTSGASLPSADQIGAMKRFPGWGPISATLDPHPPEAWRKRAAAVAASVPEEALDRAGSIVDTSFFTPPALIEHMWHLLVHSGFAGGHVLDLGCGTGRFLDNAPEGVPVTYTGVEIDPTSAQIAQILHPSARIVEGDALRVDVGTGFDAVIGNVPFSPTRRFVPRHQEALPLHAAFMSTAAAALRPGALGVFVVSRYLLDTDKVSMQRLAELVSFVAAVRLPSRYFDGTEVCADVVIVRRHTQSRDDLVAASGWPISTVPFAVHTYADGTELPQAVSVNGYWKSNPKFVAGTMCGTGYSRVPLEVVAHRPQLSVRRAFTAATKVVPTQQAGGGDLMPPDVAMTDRDGRLEGSFHIIDGRVVKITNSQPVSVERPSAELRALIGLRDSAVTLLAEESDWDNSDHELTALRQHTAQLYKLYVNDYGPLNRGSVVDGKPDDETGISAMNWRTPRLGGFRRDPQFAQVLALEIYNRETQHAEPAPILQCRVNKPPTPVQSADTPAEALAVTMSEGALSLDRVAELLALDNADQAFDALDSLVFRDPSTRGSIVTARDYLSGNVRAKLDDARFAAITDTRYRRNVDALTSVQPEWLTHTQIRIELGSPLVTCDDIRKFCTDVLGLRFSPKVIYDSLTSTWEIDSYYMGAANPTDGYSTPRMSATALLAAGLNSRVPTVYDTVLVGREHRQVRNADESEAAVIALGTLAERFAVWVWEDPHRAARIERDYNHRFNSVVERTSDGSWLRMPALADQKQLWPWQKDWVDYALARPAAMCCTPVGSGKTLSAIGLAVTLRRMGVVSRPMIAVPRHLIHQVAVEAHQAFPSCKFLMVTPEDLTRDARRLFAARCATQEWDCVIITHEGLESLPMPMHVQESWLQQHLDEARAAAEFCNAKAIARRIRTLENQLRNLRRTSRADEATVTFDQLGIDHLSVDEFDKYRRLHVTTRSEGFSLGSSARATDMHLKVWWLRSQHRRRPHFAAYTATPFVNTIAESYVYQRYFDPEGLNLTGTDAFDAWAAVFIRYDTVIETSPDGSGFRCKRRPVVIQNAPELRAMLQSFMFFSSAASQRDDLPEARFHTITAEPSAVTEQFMAALVDRADALRKRETYTGDYPCTGEDNWLAIVGEGRRVALQPELVGLTEAVDTESKLVLAADKIAEIYRRTANDTFPGSDVPGGMQMVFCDLGTPRKDGTQTYGHLRRLLTARGIPLEEIRFVQDCPSTESREALFASCRAGTTRVVIGSTPTIGVGTNAQFRLAASHHIDLPWTPAGWSQRNGRSVRPGNCYALSAFGGAVDIYVYLTARTFDAHTANLIERKAHTFAQLFTGASSDREIDDIGSIELTFADIKAAASGNDLLRRQAELSARVRRLNIARATFLQNAHLRRELRDKTENQLHDLRQQRVALDRVLPVAAKLAKLLWDFTNQVQRGGSRSSSLSGYGVRHTVNDVTVVARVVPDRYNEHTLELVTSRTCIGRVPVPNKARKDAATYQRWLSRATRRWLTDISVHLAEVERNIAEADDLLARSIEAEYATFTQHSELVAAKAELDQLNADIFAVAAGHQDTDNAA